MDKDRQIRFLYPPLIFLASLAFGFYLDNTITLQGTFKAFEKLDKTASVIIGVLGTGSVVLLLGYLLGTVTILFLRGIFLLKGKEYSYEALLSEEYYEKIENIVVNDEDKPLRKKDRVYAVFTFDHSIVSPGVHEWLVRRWNAFIIQANSAMAILFSFIVGIVGLNINFHCTWFIFSLLFFCIFLWFTIATWYETMRMIEFQTGVKRRGNEEAKNKSEVSSKPKTD